MGGDVYRQPSRPIARVDDRDAIGGSLKLHSLHSARLHCVVEVRVVTLAEEFLRALVPADLELAPYGLGGPGIQADVDGYEAPSPVLLFCVTVDFDCEVRHMQTYRLRRWKSKQQQVTS
jgi:hypothetical protein